MATIERIGLELDTLKIFYCQTKQFEILFCRKLETIEDSKAEE